MIEARTSVTLPTVTHIIPERVHELVGMELPQSVGPALLQSLSKAARLAG
jgi:hypothetical protein